MACFLVPLAIGIVLSILKKLLKKTAENLRLDILTALLLGGSFILALEHVWHGEVVPWPPFLTAMENPQDVPVVINEMLTAGTAMTIAVSATWLGIVTISRKLYSLRTVPVKQVTGIKTE